MKKNNNKLVFILIGVIVLILTVLCLLFATGKIVFKGNDSINDNNTINQGSDLLTENEALLVVKDVYNKYNLFDSMVLPAQFCGDSENVNFDVNAADYRWYVKSKQFKNLEESYNYYMTFVSRELIDKKVNSFTKNYTSTDEFPSAFLEKDGSLYCISFATGGFNYDIIDSMTEYEIKNITKNIIAFSGSVSRYEGYEIDGYNTFKVDGELQLINGNWVITKAEVK